MRNRNKQRGFTLVELIFVVTIIGILAGIVVVNAVSQRDKAIRARAKTDIVSIGNALDIYYADNGFYPSTQQGLQALITEPSTPPAPHNWNGPYLKGKKSVPRDPWGNEYVYTSPGRENPNSYDILSYGRDGQPGGTGNDADVVSWEE